MRPKQPDTAKEDLFRSSLEAILDPDHELIRLAGLIDWERFDDAFGAYLPIPGDPPTCSDDIRPPVPGYPPTLGVPR